MATTVGQYCIYVSDIEKAEEFYTEVIGLKVQTRTEIDDVHEIVVAADQGGGRLQLAERYNGGQPVDHGFALWKIYFIVDDAQGGPRQGRGLRLRINLRSPATRSLAGHCRVLPGSRRLPRRAHPAS
jgi:catechol 2,3-dioxygenase-like lactoylglutathione lyase family enzyme